MSSSRFSLREKGSPIFSVIVPVYNKGLYVSRAIQSILNQSFEDFEVIVVCDPSTDDSISKVEAFKDSRLSIFYRSEPGPGGYAARNLGIEKSEGEWVAFLDADDEWCPDHLSKMYNLSKSVPDVNFLSCAWEFVSNNGAEVNKFRKINNIDALKLSLSDYLSACLIGACPVHTNVACVRRKSVIGSEVFPARSGAKRGGDLYAWLKLVCDNKQMAWSNHIGSRYFLGVEGQVVNTAPRGIQLFKEEMLAPLVKYFKKPELIAFYKYIHKLLFGMVVSEKLKGREIDGVETVLNYRRDPLGAMRVFFVHRLVSPKILILLRAIKKNMFSRFRVRRK